MATTNPVTQVLVTSGNAAPLAKDLPLSSLAVGQIGVFDYHTGLSVDATSPAGKTKEIFFAVGVDPNGVGSLQDVVRSAGQVIQVRNAKSLTLKGTTVDAPNIIDVYGFTAMCEKDYGIKIELRNAEVYGLYGYNQFTKTFMVTTGCCSDQCSDCGTGDCIELAKLLVDNINADADQLITASYISWAIKATVTAAATAAGNLTVTIGSSVYTVAIASGDAVGVVAAKIVAAVNAAAGSPYSGVAVGAAMTFYLDNSTATGTFALTAAGGTGVTVGSIVADAKTAVADPIAFKAANPGACVGIRLTSNPSKVRNYCSINQKYFKLRSTLMIPSLIEGFACNGTITTIQDPVYGEGLGYDIRQLEYVAGGWNGKPGPYRVSELLGTARENFQYYANATTKYQQIDLTYDQASVGGWLEYLNNLQTLIAIPCADNTTLTGLVAILDAIFTQFPPATDYATAIAGNCSNTSVATVNNPEDDGIASLS